MALSYAPDFDSKLKFYHCAKLIYQIKIIKEKIRRLKRKELLGQKLENCNKDLVQAATDCETGAVEVAGATF